MIVLSPSQIKCYLQCPRKWYAKYVLKMPDPKGKAFTEGIAFHTAAEAYLLSGEIPPETDVKYATMLRDGMDKLPMATTVPVESVYVDHLVDNILIQCRLDYEFYVDRTDVTDGVGDHKTFGKKIYTMSPEELKDDVQANICANARQKRGAGDVSATWMYYNKVKKHEVFPVRATLTRESVAKVMNEVVIPAAKEIYALRAAPIGDMNVMADSNPDDSFCNHTGWLCNFSHKCRMYE